MSGHVQGFDDSLEQPGNGLREDIHIFAGRFVQPVDVGPEIRSASVERPDRKTPWALYDDVVLAVRVSLVRDDRGLGADPPGDRGSGDLVTIEVDGDAEILIVLGDAS